MRQLKKFTVIIIIAFICNFLLSKFVENFRFNEEFRWLYSYGKTFTLFLFLLLLALSIVNAILILKENKTALRERIVWTILSLSFFIYFSILILSALLENSKVEEVKIESVNQNNLK